MKIIIKIHSVIDIITNSSSEIFTIETAKTKEFLSDSINLFCKGNDIRYSITPECIDLEEESDYDLKYQIDELRRRGYKVERNDPTKNAYVISIDRDEIYQRLGPLKDFLIETFNAEIHHDG